MSIQFFSLVWGEDAHCPMALIRNPKTIITSNTITHPLFIRPPKFHNIIRANSAITPIINAVSMFPNVLGVSYFVIQKVTGLPIYSPFA